MTGKKTPSIAVVGGGLGGLAATVALSRAGFEVDVFERAPQLGEVGAGINISPQAVKALAAIGLGEGMARVGNAVTGYIQRSLYSGEPLAETRFADPGQTVGRYGAPYYAFHRADLVGVLGQAIDPARVHLGHQLADLSEGPGGITLAFANGRTHTADLVIGADGIRSRVREYLYGEDEAQFTGQMVWRALVDGSRLPEGALGPHGFYGWIGKGTHLMTYYLRGTRVINITSQADADGWVAEGWTTPGEADDMRQGFAGATPDLQRLLDAVTDCSKWGLFGRQPTGNWGRGRIQLIGDAAHPMLPNAGQGAAQAFEDAYVLARWLEAGRDDPEAALADFRHVRIPRAHAVQRQSLLNSRLVHAGDWEKRQAEFRARERAGDTPLGLGWIYGWEPQQQWNVRQEYPLSFGEPATA